MVWSTHRANGNAFWFLDHPCVQATQPAEAIDKAVALVVDESDGMCVNGPQRPYFTLIAEIQETDESTNPEQFVNRGFSFYQQDSLAGDSDTVILKEMRE